MSSKKNCGFLVNQDDEPYLGEDIGDDAWVCEDRLLANSCAVKPTGDGPGNAFLFRDTQLGEEILLYGDFERQLPYVYDTVPKGSQIQPSGLFIQPRKYNDPKIQGRLQIAARALVATSGDPIKASRNMFIPSDTPCCTLCRVRSDDSKVNLKLCARCHQKSYCCKECQVVDWKLYHKFECISHLVTTHTKGILTPKSI